MEQRSKLRSFLKKTNRDKAAAIRATIRSRVRRIKHGDDGSSAVTGALALPRVLDARHRLYLAYRPDSDYDFDRHPELRSLSANWIAGNVTNNAGDLPRLYMLAFNIKQVLAEKVLGDFAEVGVYRGNSAAMLAYYGRQERRDVFLFDTFSGFDESDLVGIDGNKGQAFTDTSLALVKKNVGDEGVFYLKGYFPATVTAEVSARRFAIVHLDCDLYEPIKAGMEFFYPRLSPGGLFIVHDYGNPHYDGAKRAVDEYLASTCESVILAADKSGTALIRKSRA
jgi:hypothetical protein